MKFTVSACSAVKAIDGWNISGITAFSSGNSFTVTSGVDTNLDGTTNDARM